MPTWKIIYFKYVTHFKQATFNSTTPISNYKGGAFEYLIYHGKALVVCLPKGVLEMSLSDKKRAVGIEIVEKNKIRSFTYSTAVQRNTLPALMFFNNWKRCCYQHFTSKKRNIKKLHQNLKIN